LDPVLSLLTIKKIMSLTCLILCSHILVIYPSNQAINILKNLDSLNVINK